MKQRLRTIFTCLLISAMAIAGEAIASTPEMAAQDLENINNLCAEQTARHERLTHIPSRLLTAISLVESGYWDPERKANIAWPWTVTSGPKSWRLASKEDAITQVLELWADGVENIDVGCMQINLRHHGEAFRDLEQAFDPSSNVAYAAKYLQELYSIAKSWTEAAGYFHSKTPERYRPYKLKVIKMWNDSPSSPGLAPGSMEEAKINNQVPVDRRRIDAGRTNELNARFKTARAAASGESQKEPPKSQLPEGNLDGWQGGAKGATDIALSAIKRRSQAASQRQNEMRGKALANDAEAFEAKRMNQLQTWRQTGRLAKASARL